MTGYHNHSRGIFRSDNGVLLGVFAGLAERFGLSVKGLRLAGIIGLILTGLWPLVGLYLLAALLMKPAREGCRTGSRSWTRRPRPARESSSFSRSAEAVEKRLRNLEDAITSKEYDWERRLNQQS